VDRERVPLGWSAAVRLALVALGGVAIAWGATAFPVFFRTGVLVHVAARIEAGDIFKPEVLRSLMPAVEEAEGNGGYCRPEAGHAAAILRIRILADSISDGDRQAVDGDFDDLDRSIRAALRCSPADSFLWTVLYRVEATRFGFDSRQIAFLRLSYQLGPNEGWIAVKRNALALAIYAQLPKDLQKMALDEFANLLNTGLLDETLAIFTGPGWPIRDLLLTRIKSVAERHRQEFANALYRDGYDIKVPGIEPPEPRPWR
jgi:hypothetical protein